VGPFGLGTRRVTPRAEFAPARDGSLDWVVRDQGQEIHRAPLDGYRISVLWKADVHPTRAERLELEADQLSLADVAAIFDRDLEARGASGRFELERLDDPATRQTLALAYPEPVPLGARPSIYDPM
ncbi:hypothetical protein K2X89_06785, partial [Myxococcota bacterium]|nr:hypothetical protein [Myxococcota bacterium]